MSFNLTPYLPQPFTMECGPYTITSPVPNAETGKLIAAFQELQAEQARRAEAGEPPIVEEITGWPTTVEEVARLALGDEEYERLTTDGCPPAFINQAAMCAVIYWANGGSEDAVRVYLQWATNPEDAEQAAPKGRARRKSGRSTASETPSA